MSGLQKRLQNAGLPPMMPPRQGGRVPLHKRKDYTPLSWDKYYERKEIVKTSRGEFCTYSKGTEGPLVVCLHGGGFSALTWALFSKHLAESATCHVLAFDQRGHGETVTPDDSDLSIDTLASDVGAVISAIYSDTEAPPIILLGHSMGGSVAVHASKSDLVPSQIGLIVVDVVEGSAMEALNGMKAFLRGRPAMFKSLEHAIEWSVRSGQIKNTESARVSMIGQVKPCVKSSQSESSTTGNSAILTTDSITEEEEESQTTDNHPSPTQSPDAQIDSDSNTNSAVDKTPHKWRIDLENTEHHWIGWFQGLSSQFLSVPVPKVLILAGVDRLDKELAIGQMQGKFQMQIVGQVGHAVHEDAPDKVADVVATYLVRNKFAAEGEHFHRNSQAMFPSHLGRFQHAEKPDK